MNPYDDSWFTIASRRPVLTIVLNTLIIIAGIVSYLGVDIREIPDVDRPVIGVRAVYKGASPKTMDSDVTRVIEGAVARVSGVKNITSSSEENNMRLRAEFSPSLDLNIAANDVREAVSRIQRQLPDDIDQLVVVKADSDAEPIIQLSAESSSMPQALLAEKIKKEVIPKLISVPGVADVRLEGLHIRTLKVMLDPAKLAGFRVNVQDVLQTLRMARFDVPAGSYKSSDQDLLVRAFASVADPISLERLIVSENIRIGDLGSVYWAPEQADSYTLMNGRNVIGLGIIRQAGSNTIEISNEIQSRISKINYRVRDYKLSIVSDDSIYIKGALEEVVFTLIISIVIVLFLIWIFIGNLKAVMIPAATMPISLIGTIAGIWMLGFSINLVTLLALVLASGLIVDDAIVVLENIQRHRYEGKPSLIASIAGTKQVFFAVVSTTITLVAVFVPIAFLPGEAGRIFQEFGLVLSISVVISSFVALTLCPLMASRLVDPTLNMRSTPFRVFFEKLGLKASNLYVASLHLVLSYKVFVLLCSIALVLLGVYTFLDIDRELLPKEDKGSINIIATGPDGVSLSYSDRQSQKIEAILETYVQSGIVRDVYTIVGRWDKNRVYTKALLAPWEQRDISQMKLASEIGKKLRKIPGIRVRISQPRSLKIRGAGRGLKLAILSTDYDYLHDTSLEISQIMQAEITEIKDINIQFDTSQPEIEYTIDRDKARDLEVPMQAISDTLKVMVDEYEVLDLSIDDQAIPLIVGSSKGVINDPSDLLNIFVTNKNKELIPLQALIQVKERGVSAELDRHAQRRAIELSVDFDEKISLGKLASKVEEFLLKELPSDCSFIFLGEAATLNESNHQVLITFGIALLVVFLILAAQFESFNSAVIVIFTVPFGVSLAVFALILSGQTFNLYSQIGFILLVGLMTKNAILLIEFMEQSRDRGCTIEEAIEEAIRYRLRPVIMTVLSTVIGSLPLILSSGPGAEARHAIGWVVFGGLALSAIVTLYLAPLGYSLLAPFSKSRAYSKQMLSDQIKSHEAKS